ncbi:MULTISPECIES: LLM class flavin-dependent oxidoreductase [unclassified Pseudoalteromonas]|uniref:LLM class flavin-dependent oxidoreductase n=1 Tax=unclassified Pseudoalteromonas TaxID=194690 RepID=UPI001F3EFD02|nr:MULTISPECIES: LLM class flavin-dependent oxidoreductase [unclassified Pseudoalteromonas]MCF2828136.1 LLM class flavin-dependent oxidoreductase [Pseudoalteromonas sp. OF5H-5]MCF2833756.1 LLM class flavin-dependent oxidoreductase [Pseudoalteromonas sp. DL2-H6]MCF2924081.1 LLM class flavin-dependent oxidoreductase [Pseudoalteromonas sp. DL2-H1]MCX2767643.1 LLM class flavin-dependent oxidoreductase [Pseudoalteromonas sp. B530]
MTSLANMPFSLLELSPMKEQDTVSQTLANSVAYAQKADELGFKRFWMAEHHNMRGIVCAATSVLIGHIAGHTHNIRVGAGGVMLPNHPPLVVAEQFGTLESLYPGRIDLGLGRAPGSDPITSRALRRDDRRAEQFDDEVAELQALLGPYDGRSSVRAIPGENTKVPIWLLGSSLYSAQLAAKRGLPYAFAGHFAPRFVHDAIALYRRDFQPSKVLDKPYVMLGLPVVAADTDEQAQYLATTSKQRILALMRGQALWLKPPVDSMEGLWNAQEQMQVESFLGLSVVGSPATVHHKLSMIKRELAVDEFIFTNDLYELSDRKHALEILASLT